MQCCIEGCTSEAIPHSRLKRCELHTLEHQKAKAQEYAKKQWQRAKAARSHLCSCGCGKVLTGRKLLAEGCKPKYRPKGSPQKSRPCRCGCGVTVYGGFQYASDECRAKRPRKRYRNAGHDEVQAAMKEQAAINAASKPAPRVTLSDEERDALDRAKRLAEVAAEKELAERRKHLDPRLLFARRFAGIIPIYAEGYASRQVEYQPPQRAQTLAADRMAMWES